MDESAPACPYRFLGELIGYARMYNESISEYSHDFDIAVRVSTSYGERYVSFFDVVTDTLFTDFASRGSTDRGDFIITADERDASPMTCDGETFTNSSAIADWFSLDPKVAGAPCQSNEECASNSCVTNACSP